jgi:putative Holliday junction resolvase
MNKRILCLDVGDVRIGVAVSDLTRTIATPVEVIHRVGWGPDCRRIRMLCDQFETDEVLSGLPLNMDDSVGERAVKTLAFRDILEARLSLPVVMQDERLTSVTAEEVMRESGVRREDYGKYVDSIAAAIILQDYLNAHERKDSGDN